MSVPQVQVRKLTLSHVFELFSMLLNLEVYVFCFFQLDKLGRFLLGEQ